MTNQLDSQLITLSQAWARAASLIVILAGGLVLIGWGFDVAALKSVWPGLATMKANTALSFVLAGGSLWLLTGEPDPPRRRLAWTCAAFVAVFALLTLSQDLGGWKLGIDQLLFRDSTAGASTTAPGRMSPATAVNFILIGSALLLLDVKLRAAWRVAQFLALAAGILALLAVIGYSYNVQSLYRLTPFSSMALHTALAFCILALAILAARPDQGMTALLVDRTLGGLMLRRLLPAAVLIPIALTWLHLLSERAGLLENDTGEALFAMLQVVIFTGLIWWNAGLLRRTDTERMQVEAALRLSEERFEKAFRASPEALVISHMATGQIIEVNERWDEIFGFSPEETVGQSSLALKLFENPADRQRAVDIIRTQGSLRDFELTVRPKSGRQRHIIISAEMMEIDNERCLLTMIADITERKQAEAEVRRLNQELEQRVVERTAQLEAANKELEAFAYSVSHDLRAPLRSIDGFSQALLEDYADKIDDEGQRFLHRVRAATQRMAQLIDDLLALSRITRGEMIYQTVNLSAIAWKVVEELRQSDPERQVEFVIAEELAVYGDARLLQVAVENLLRNAWKFTGNHTQARIEVGAVEQAGQTVYFVRDDGAGFDMTYADKLFGAFQRLHGMNEFPGTGIGLATVQRVIHRHGGLIWAEGRVEKGATFYFTLAKER